MWDWGDQPSTLFPSIVQSLGELLPTTSPSLFKLLFRRALRKAQLVRGFGLSTTVLPNPVEWIAVFEDQTTFSSVQGNWSEFSDLVEVRGVSFYLSRQPIREVTVIHDGRNYSLFPDVPMHCFAFHRWAALPQQDPVWLYSVFGFERDTLRILLRIGKRGGQTRIEDRTQPIIL